MIHCFYIHAQVGTMKSILLLATTLVLVVFAQYPQWWDEQRSQWRYDIAEPPRWWDQDRNGWRHDGF